MSPLGGHRTAVPLACRGMGTVRGRRARRNLYKTHTPRADLATTPRRAVAILRLRARPPTPNYQTRHTDKRGTTPLHSLGVRLYSGL